MRRHHRAGRRGLTIAAVVLAGASAPVPAGAKEEPLLEFGLGAGAIAFEDYRGSDTTHAYPIPVPYLVYNGTFPKADREGVRGSLFNVDPSTVRWSSEAAIGRPDSVLLG